MFDPILCTNVCVCAFHPYLKGCTGATRCPGKNCGTDSGEKQKRWRGAGVKYRRLQDEKWLQRFMKRLRSDQRGRRRFKGQEMDADTDRAGEGGEMWTRKGVWEKFSGVLVAGGHGPGPLHPPDGEGIAESFVGQVVAAGQLGIHLVALQHLVKEVDVAWGQLQDLDFAQLVWR